ncbi:hypothetical protein DX912_13745 [Lysobacter soli]|uniref:Uncharacterized protein n=1 Tax=Lysobacter soli TaxID=453783 RepID=A0A3D8VA92_9GAMM|nr:hypothetical protein DX912_13745 [Lysobacter soli]
MGTLRTLAYLSFIRRTSIPTVIPAKAGIQARNLRALPYRRPTSPSFQRKLESILLQCPTAKQQRSAVRHGSFTDATPLALTPTPLPVGEGPKAVIRLLLLLISQAVS